MEKLLKLISRARGVRPRRKRVDVGWMRGQLAKMASLDQGLIQMSVGR